MQINFKRLTLDDKSFIDGILKDSDKRFCEYTFGNMFCWGNRYDMKIALTQNGFITGSTDKRRFNFPAGKDAMKIVSELENMYDSFTLTSLSKDEAMLFEGKEGYTVTETPERFDYIYESEKLRLLKGKKLASKRNHINAFLSDGEYSTEPITMQNIPYLYDFNTKWCQGLCESDSSLLSEMCAVRLGLENFERLGFSGLILYKNKRICAYSYGEPINNDTFCVHVEKADSLVRGAYQMINREFANAYCENFAYINREDDAGDEGLAKAKRSYYPTEIGTKFKVEYKK